MGLIIGLNNNSKSGTKQKEIVVPDLPERGVPNVYYVVQPEGSDKYSVFIWIDSLSDWYQISSADSVPTKTSDLVNDKGYVTATIDEENIEMLKFNV